MTIVTVINIRSGQSRGGWRPTGDRQKAQQEEEQSWEQGGGRGFAERKASLFLRLCVYVYVCVYVWVCTLIHVSQKPEESVRSPGARVTGDGGSKMIRVLKLKHWSSLTAEPGLHPWEDVLLCCDLLIVLCNHVPLRISDYGKKEGTHLPNTRQLCS